MFRFCFNSKATPNARYEQMTKQQQLIEQKKQEIQKKLEEKKRKETEEALKKLNPQAAAVVDRRGPSSSNPKNRWKSNDVRKRNSEVLNDNTSSSLPTNIFSNDGSFLDQFRKLTGMRAPKIPKQSDDRYETSNYDTRFDIMPDSAENRNYNMVERDIDTIREFKNESIMQSESSEKISSRKWDKMFEENQRDCSKSPPRPSRTTSVSYGYQLSQIQSLNPTGMITSMPPLPPLPPLPYTRPNNPMSSFYSVPVVPSSLTASSIPPPAPINPCSIPSPSPILPCSIPSPSPIQPSAIPPPSPIIPHSIPPPSPISPNMIPQPSPLSLHEIPPPPPHTHRHPVSPMIPPTSMISQPAPPGVCLIQHNPPRFPPGDIPPLPPTVPHPSLPIIKYPTLEPRTKTDLNQVKMPPVPVGTQHLVTVPAEQFVTEERIFKDVKEEQGSRSGEEDETDESEIKKELLSVEEWKQASDRHELRNKLNEETDCHPSPFTIDAQISISPTCKVKEENNSSSYVENSIDGIPLVESNMIKFEPVTTSDIKIKRGEQHQLEEVSQEADSARRKKRKSRWAPEEDVSVSTVGPVGPVGVVTPIVLGATPVPPPTNTPTINVPGMKGTLISQISRTDPALLQYAIQNFGSTQLTEEDWKKAEDHYKINLLYQDMLKKRHELEKLQAAGKFKYEYDSDEETEGGTWEHKLREKEMVATQLWADELTEAAKGKHHIGDFLPPEELSRFMEKYEALKQGRPPDLSDYKEYKLKEDNIGFQMLQKLGWTEGQGLGSDGSGIVDPVNKATVRADNQGLGIERPDDVSAGDDEYDAYRKRMMLAYRFRPNPLNNPRRPYY